MAVKKAKTYKYVTVRFLSTYDEAYAKGYTYENPVKAKKYDTVVVPTVHGLCLAVVVSSSDTPPDTYMTYKAITEVIKSTSVDKLTQVKKKADLKKKLEAEVKKMDEVERFNIYAASNPAFAELLEEYKTLS